MFVAYDTRSETAVLGPEQNDHDPQAQIDSGARYQCLLCDSDLLYQRASGCDPFKYFIHPTSDCVSDGNMSAIHRLGQELVVKKVVNWLPHSANAITLDLERRIGSDSQFIICDILISEPVQLGIEIIFRTSRISLRRRLRTLFKNGYSSLFIFLTTGRISPSRVEHHLQTEGISRVGRLDPYSLDVKLGSIFAPDTLDPDTLDPASFPEYLI